LAHFTSEVTTKHFDKVKQTKSILIITILLKIKLLFNSIN